MKLGGEELWYFINSFAELFLPLILLHLIYSFKIPVVMVVVLNWNGRSPPTPPLNVGGVCKLFDPK